MAFGPRKAWAAGLLCILWMMTPPPAVAEKGAMTFEAAAAMGATALTPPLATPETEGLHLSIMPLASVSVRYAFTHDLGLGLSIAGEPFRWIAHEGVLLDVGGNGTPLPGQLEYSYAAFSIAAFSRLFLVGYDWRLYLEPTVGWNRRMYRDLDHLQVIEGEEPRSYPLSIDPFSTNDLLLGLGVGLEYVKDRSAFGARLLGTALLGDRPACRGQVVLYAAYDLYP